MALSYSITQLSAIATLSDGDLLVIVDVSDFSEAPTGTTKKLTKALLFTGPTFTGTTTAAAIAASGNVTVGGTLGVTVSATFSNGLTVTNGTISGSYGIGGGGVQVGTSTNHTLRFYTNNVEKWYLATNGDFAPVTDAVYDIGVGGNRPRNVLASGSITGLNLNATNGTVTGNVQIGSSVLQVGTSTNHDVQLISNNTPRWDVAAAGHLLAFVDNTYDIGASGATRPRNLFLANNATVAGTVTAGTSVTAPSLGGALTTAAQPAITSVGTLTSLAVSGNETVGGTLGVTGASTFNALLTAGTINNVTLNASLNVIAGGTVQGTTLQGTHLVGLGSAPAVSGMPSGWTAAISGTDVAGKITLTMSGTGYTAGNSIATVTFASSFATAPSVVVSGQSTTAIAYLFNAPTTTAFQVAFNANLSGAGLTVVFHYHATGV
jgi:phage FluMu protein gp41